MGWKTLEDAAKRGPSRATWERRVETDRVPHYLDAATGRRMVWIEGGAPPPPERDLGELRRTVAELRALLGDLQRQRPAPALRRQPAPPIVGRAPRRPAVTTSAPAARTSPTFATPEIPEAEVARIMALRAECPLGDKALQRAAGLASNWFWKVKRGKCRSALAREGWSRLEAFLQGHRQRRAA